MAFHTVQHVLAEWSAWIWPRLLVHIAEATLFALGAFLLAARLKRAPGRAKYYIWLMAMAKFALPSVAFIVIAMRFGADFSGVSRLLHTSGYQAALVTPVKVTSILSPNEPVPSSATEVTTTRDPSTLYSVLTWIWLAGVVGVAVLWARWGRMASRLVRMARIACEGRETQALDRAQRKLGVRSRVRLLISSEVCPPAVYGVLRPVIILPVGIADHLSAEGLESIFLHELAHVRHADNLASNLQMLLCGLFWFHPLVWLLDRKLIAERERARDGEVTAFSGAELYAASVLAVGRLCGGLDFAGVSRATGADIRARMEEIMAPQPRRNAPMAHRALSVSTLIFLIGFSIFSGVFDNPGIFAQTRRTTHSPYQPELAPAQTSIAPTRATPRADGARELTADQTQQLDELVSNAPETAIRFENSAGSPVRIRSASLKIVPVGGEWLITPPVISLTNLTDKRIARLTVELSARNVLQDSVSFDAEIAPYDSYRLGPGWHSWSNQVKSIHASQLLAKVIGVRFDDGQFWGDLHELLGAPEEARMPPPSPPALPELPPSPGSAPRAEMPPLPSPPPRRATPAPRPLVDELPLPQPPATEYVPAQFMNPPGAPFVITEAKTRLDQPVLDENQPALAAVFGSGPIAYLPLVTLTNTSDRRIVAMKLRFKADADTHAVTAMKVPIEPHASYLFSRDSAVSGDPRNMHVQVLGVEFEDGSIWGSLDSQVNSRDLWINVPLTIRKSTTGH